MREDIQLDINSVSYGWRKKSSTLFEAIVELKQISPKISFITKYSS